MLFLLIKLAGGQQRAPGRAGDLKGVRAMANRLPVLQPILPQRPIRLPAIHGAVRFLVKIII